MKFHRPDRVSSLLRDQLNQLILREIETPGALLTITDVQISKDVTQAMVKISVLPAEKAGEVLKILEKARKSLQYQLVRKMNIKPTPQIAFRLDLGPEKAAQVEKALLEVEEGEEN